MFSFRSRADFQYVSISESVGEQTWKHATLKGILKGFQTPFYITFVLCSFGINFFLWILFHYSITSSKDRQHIYTCIPLPLSSGLACALSRRVRLFWTFLVSEFQCKFSQPVTILKCYSRLTSVLCIIYCAPTSISAMGLIFDRKFWHTESWQRMNKC